MASVEIENLTKQYSGNTVVDSINITVEEGEFLTLLGPSGCGKSTTLRCIAGLERPDGGTIRIGNKEVVGPSTYVQPNKRGLGMVFQSYALWPHMTVSGNVGYPLKRAGVNRSDVTTRAQKALDVVGLGHLSGRPVGTLSGGQQQRVALARAIVAEPPLVLFDEPLSNLDTRLRGTMREELRQLRERLGTTSVYVTHDQTEALTLSDRIIVLNQGSIQQVGTPEEIYSYPENLFVADFLGYENFLEGVVEQVHGNNVRMILLGGGALEIEARKAPAVGDTVVLVARASDFKILPADTLSGSKVSATVQSRLFLGDQTEFHATVGEQSVSVRVPSTSATAREVKPGEEIHLDLESGTFSLFQE